MFVLCMPLPGTVNLHEVLLLAHLTLCIQFSMVVFFYRNRILLASSRGVCQPSSGPGPDRHLLNLSLEPFSLCYTQSSSSALIYITFYLGVAATAAVAVPLVATADSDIGVGSPEGRSRSGRRCQGRGCTDM